MKHLLAIAIALLPSAALAQQFTPQQMLDVMTKSPSNRDVRVEDNLDINPIANPEIAPGYNSSWIVGNSPLPPVFRSRPQGAVDQQRSW